MAVSGNTQRAFYSKPADQIEFFNTKAEADAFADEKKAEGLKARVYSWNNGTRAKPRIEYKTHVWNKK